MKDMLGKVYNFFYFLQLVCCLYCTIPHSPSCTLFFFSVFTTPNLDFAGAEVDYPLILFGGGIFAARNLLWRKTQNCGFMSCFLMKGIVARISCIFAAGGGGGL